MRNYFLAICFLFLIVSCSTEHEPGTRHYPDFQKILKEESEKLKLNNLEVEKTIILNGEKEIRKYRVDDWETELSVLNAGDIHRPSWGSSFNTAKAQAENGTSTTAFIAKDSLPDVKSFSVDSVGDKAIRYKYHRHINNNIYMLDENGVFTPDSGYSISSVMKPEIGTARDFFVSLTVVK